MNLDFTVDTSKRKVIEAGLYQAVLCEIEDMGLHPNYNKVETPHHKFWFQTEPIEVDITDDEGNKTSVTERFFLRTYPIEVKSKRWFDQMRAIFGTTELPKDSKSEDLIGKNVVISIVNGLKDGVPYYNNIDAKLTTKAKSKSKQYEVEGYEEYKEKRKEREKEGFSSGKSAEADI